VLYVPKVEVFSLAGAEHRAAYPKTSIFFGRGKNEQRRIGVKQLEPRATTVSRSRTRTMKQAAFVSVLTLACLGAAAAAWGIYIPPTHYTQPPSKESKSDWPTGLAEVISQPSYVDGWSYANPGFVVDMNDTFFYDGDTEALGEFLKQLRAVKDLDVKITFSNAAGYCSEFVRAGVVFQGNALGQPLNTLGSKPCSWLVTVTDQKWVQRGGASNVTAQVLIFLGSKKIDIEKLEM
jgi:hypothetical protein